MAAWFREAGPILDDGAHINGARDLVLDFQKFDADGATVRAGVRDFELFARALSAHPERAIELVRAAQAGRLIRAAELMREMGLSEDQLKSAGGGPLWFVVLVVVVAIAVIASPGNVPVPEHSLGDEQLKQKQEHGTVSASDQESENLHKLEGLFKK